MSINKLIVLQRLSMFAQLFSCALAITILHRAIGVAIHFKRINFRYTYNPSEGFNQYHTYIQQFGTTIANGIREDFLFCFFVGGLLLWVSRSVRLAAFALLAVFYAGNLEHIRYNMTSFELRLMGMGVDTTFILAHVTKQFLLFLVLLLVSVAVMRAFQLVRFGQLSSIGIMIVAIPFSLVPLFPISISQPFWMQSHPLVPNMRSAAVEDDNRAFNENPLVPEESDSGAGKAPEMNLLLVYMEGLSYLSIEKGEMHYLRSLADSNISYERYFAHQLITANGLYSTLTGRLPRFVDTELTWDDIESENPAFHENSIPAILKGHGYQTSFIQSAPLSFMSKDKILPHLGFDEVIGDEAHPVTQPRGGWGVDDRSLFRNVISHIDSLEKNKPWMISVLTTGTHSPYFVPDDYLSESDNDRFRALRYADEAIEELIKSLESRGLLENTVVVITADESRETTGKGSLQDEIALNWLPLVVLTPDKQSSRVTDHTVNSELPNLIWTLLDDSQTDLPVDNPEAIIFGNITGGRVIWYDEVDENLFVCENQDFACGLYADVTDLAQLDGIKPIKQARFPQLKELVLSYD